MKIGKSTIIATGIICILPIIAGFILWNKLPGQMATSFDWSGVPTIYRPKWFAVLIIPLMITALHGLSGFSILKREGYGHIRELVYGLIVINCPIIGNFASISLYAYALGYDLTLNFIAMGTVLVVSLVYGISSILKW